MGFGMVFESETSFSVVEFLPSKSCNVWCQSGAAIMHLTYMSHDKKKRIGWVIQGMKSYPVIWGCSTNNEIRIPMNQPVFHGK